VKMKSKDILGYNLREMFNGVLYLKIYFKEKSLAIGPWDQDKMGSPQ